MSDELAAMPFSPSDIEALQAIPPLRIQIGGVEAMFLMSALQLACRHETLRGPVRATVEEFARGLQERISVTPGLADISEAGWHSEFDTPSEPHAGLILPGDERFRL